jgi:hypothetical protein
MSLATRRRSRALLSVLAGVLMLLLASQTALAAVSWTKPVGVGPQYSWNTGRGLARTVSSSTSYLHVQYEDDGHAHVGVYYRRGNAGGTAWGTARRLNPPGEHAEAGAIAAASKYVYVVYRDHSHLTNDYDPAGPRGIHVSINTNHGSSTAWLTTKNFEAPTRAGRPAVAATGSYAYVAFTDADNGNVVLAKNGGTNVEDAGWTAGNVGVTTRVSTSTGDGFEGNPVVAASGALVMVAWIDSDDGTIKAKVSTDHGATWPDTASTLSAGQVYGLSAAGLGSRLALAWATPSSIRVRVYAGAWGPARTLASFSPTGTWRNGYGTSVALAGTSRVGVGFSACTRASCAGSSTQGVDVRWRESTNNGSTWKSTVTIASHKTAKSTRISDNPSVVMTDSPKRFMTYNTASASFSTYRLVIEVGSGKP